MNLENTIELFYGNTSKIINFYWYLDCDTIMSCMKINKYFYNKKKLLYKLMISYLGMYPNCLYNNFLLSPCEEIYYNNKYYSMDEIIYLIHIKIGSNKMLNRNSYLINRFKILMKYIRLDKLYDNKLRSHYTNSLSCSFFSSAVNNNSVISCV